MRKLLFLLFAALVVLGCSADENMPCLGCSKPFQPLDCDQLGAAKKAVPMNYFYCYSQNSYYGYSECSYTSSCEGTNYGNDNTCGGSVLPP